MKKASRITALVLALILALSLCVFASGEASGSTSGETTETAPKTPGETPAEVILAAMACRNFSDEPLTQEQVDAILRAGANAPSAFNSEPWKFIVLENTEKKVGLISNEVATCIIVAVPVEDYNLGANSQFAAGLAAESMYLYAQASGLAANMYVAPCDLVINVSDDSKAEYGISPDYEAAIILGIGNYADEIDAFASASARTDVAENTIVVK
ncbi:MAG: nitroreductase family protein [Oscillospiraceae bacterium]